jgi:ABC-type transport system involved in multi-copper enzyme maturation permease subunit
MSSSAPEWTTAIADSTLCGYFYVVFIIFSVLAGLSVLSAIYMFATTKITGGLVLAVLFAKLINFGISAAAALFAYLICDRALKPAATQAAKQSASGSGLLMM